MEESECKRKKEDYRTTNWNNLPADNRKFEEFYKNIIDEHDWDKFMGILSEKLPISFRLTNSMLFQPDEIDLCQQYIKIVPEIQQLSWYPNGFAWQLNVSRKDVKKSPEYNKFYQFLNNETLFGSLSRQETVSMIPPILMDVQPYHKILDMCSSPGSKTAQLLESLYAHSPSPDGFVIGNDMDINRCAILISQMKRIRCPPLVITCQDARNFPSLIDGTSSTDAKYMRFDRVLCDVPCSMQKDILKRGLELLKVDGLLVYSTCSMNPVENEAVLLTMLRKYKNQIELVDISKILQGLEYRQGLKDWSFVNSLKFKYKKGPIPTAENYEYDEYKLKNCVRIYPYLQNTGGFFVALLRKTSEISQHDSQKALSDDQKQFMFKKKLKRKFTIKNNIRLFDDNEECWKEINFCAKCRSPSLKRSYRDPKESTAL